MEHFWESIQSQKLKQIIKSPNASTRYYLTYFSGEGDNAGLCAHILTAFSFFLFLVTVPLSLCMCVKVFNQFRLHIQAKDVLPFWLSLLPVYLQINKSYILNIQCVCLLMYGALFWSRENCSILRRRNKLIKSRTDHKRTVKWQPVWFGNLQLKLSSLTIKRVKFPGKKNKKIELFLLLDE